MTASRVAQVLAERQVDRLQSFIQGDECEGSKFHSPRPLLTRPYQMVGLVEAIAIGAQYPRGEDVWLCSTCFDNLSVYVMILIAYDGATPQFVRRDFGNQIRHLGDEAWRLHRFNRSDADPV